LLAACGGGAGARMQIIDIDNIFSVAAKPRTRRRTPVRWGFSTQSRLRRRCTMGGETAQYRGILYSRSPACGNLAREAVR
jgi:hypothetical protein